MAAGLTPQYFGEHGGGFGYMLVGGVASPVPRRIDNVRLEGGWKLKLIHSASPRNVPRVGLCDYAAKTLTVYTRHPGADPLDTAIHEALHLAYPFLDEDAVSIGAATVTPVVRALVKRVPDAVG